MWTREDATQALRELIARALFVPVERVRPEASLIYDLGAESVDLLDLAVKIEDRFGAAVPLERLQDIRVAWRDRTYLAEVVRDRLGLDVPPRALRAILPASLRAVADWLGREHGVQQDGGLAMELACGLVARLLADLDALGVEPEAIGPDLIAAELVDDLLAPALMERVIRGLTVGALERALLRALALG
jgi:acyl carrier protein